MREGGQSGAERGAREGETPLHTRAFISVDSFALCCTAGSLGSAPGLFDGPSSLAVVPGLGLIVREQGNGGRLQVFPPKV